MLALTNDLRRTRYGWKRAHVRIERRRNYDAHDHERDRRCGLRSLQRRDGWNTPTRACAVPPVATSCDRAARDMSRRRTREDASKRAPRGCPQPPRRLKRHLCVSPQHYMTRRGVQRRRASAGGVWNTLQHPHAIKEQYSAVRIR